MKTLETETVQLINRRLTSSSVADDSDGSASSLLPEMSPRQRRQSPPVAAPTAATSSPENAATVNNDYKYVFYDLPRAGVIGILTGAAVAIFKIAIESLRLAAYSMPGMKEAPATAFVPAFGGLMVGLLALFGPFPPGLKGIIQETDGDSKALFFDDDSNKKFNILAFFRKTLAAIITLGTGCSMGPEGPSVEIGVSLSRLISTTLNQIPASNVSEIVQHNRLLLSCGGAAGVAAGFNAPIAGIFFALEVIQGFFVSLGQNQVKSDDVEEVDTENLISTKGGISSIVLSAVLAALVCKTMLGDELVFKVADYSLKTPLLELPLYLFLGSLCGVLAFAFIQLSSYTKLFFDGELGPGCLRCMMKAMPSILKPMFGGMFSGVLGLKIPQILFFGYETLNNLLTKSSLTSGLLLTWLSGKMMATAVAVSSGLVGGLFAPSLFFGGMLGACFHNFFEYVFDSIGRGIAEQPAYAMIGSASVLAALFRAPLTGSLILFECTREYDVILPLMASCGIASIVADVLELWMNRQQATPQATPRDSLTKNGSFSEALTKNDSLDDETTIPIGSLQLPTLTDDRK